MNFSFSLCFLLLRAYSQRGGPKYRFSNHFSDEINNSETIVIHLLRDTIECMLFRYCGLEHR